MAYYFFMAGTMLPVAPSEFTISIPSKNETVTLIDDGDASILKDRGLKEFDFEMYLPQVKYPFASYTSSYASKTVDVDTTTATVETRPSSNIIPPLEYLILLQRLKEDKLPFRLDIYRELPTGEKTWTTNETVSLEDYTVTESTDNGFDVVVSVKLKEYRQFATRKVVLSEDGLTYHTERASYKQINRIIQARENDTLDSICMREYGYVSVKLKADIYELNRATFESYNNDGASARMVHAGMMLKMY